MTYRFFFRDGVIAGASLAFVLGCGGGGSSAPQAPGQPTLQAPSAVVTGTTRTASVQSPASGVTFAWTVQGGTFQGGGATASGATVTFVAGAAGTLTLTCTASNSGGASQPATATVTVAAAPSITSFQGTPGSITAGQHATLTAVFGPGTGLVTPGNLAIFSGTPLDAGALAATTTFTLTVTSQADPTQTETQTALVSVIPLGTPSFTATGALAPTAYHTATLLGDGQVLIAGAGNGTSGLAGQSYDPVSGAFTATGPLSVMRTDHTATLLPDGTVLVAGGDQTALGTPPPSTAERYNPATGVFSLTGSLSTARYRHGAVLLPNGKVLISGGEQGQGSTFGYLATQELYDPATGTFAPTGVMATARASFRPVLLRNGKVLLAGGVNSDGPQNAAELYDWVSGTCSPAGAMTQARCCGTATLLPSGKVLVAGDTLGSPSAELYDPALNTFTATGAMTSPRAHQAAVLLPDGTVLMVGGVAPAESSSQVVASAECYRPATGTFTATTAMAAARMDFTATLLPNGRVLVAGGYNGGTLGTAELYDTGQAAPAAFQPVPALGTARDMAAAATLADGTLLVVGGRTSSADTSGVATTERFDPFTLTFTGSAPVMGTARYGHTAVRLADGRLFVAGGWGSSASLASTELLNVGGTAFTPGPSMARGRGQHAAVLLPDGRVLLVGGLDGNVSLGTAELFDPVAGTLSAPIALQTLGLGTATLLPTGRVLVAGRAYVGGNWQASAELFAPATNTFTVLTPPAVARIQGSATLQADGRVLLAGGMNGNSFFSSAERYDPWAGTFTTLANGLPTPLTGQGALLLPRGPILLAGGESSLGQDLAAAVLFDPQAQQFAATGTLGQARMGALLVPLPDGTVLVVGGYDTAKGCLNSVERFQ